MFQPWTCRAESHHAPTSPRLKQDVNEIQELHHQVIDTSPVKY